LWIVPNPQWMAVDMFERFAVRFWSWPETAGFIAYVVYGGVALGLLLKRGRTGLLGFAMLCPWLMFATEFSTVRIQETFVLYRSYLWMPCLFAALPFVFRRVKAGHAMAILSVLVLVFTSLAANRLVTFSSALKLWDDAARLVVGKDNRPGVERIYHNRGLAFTRESLFDRGLTDLNKSLALKPDQVFVLNDRGVTLSLLKRYPEALRDFNSALAIAPGFMLSHFGRAQALGAMGDKVGAHAEYLDMCKRGMADGCRGLPREELNALLREERERIDGNK
jgi:tetratricopeptide (TPR) repeat protein